MKIALAIGSVLLALLWTGFIGISAALADWVAGQGGQLQGGLQTIAQWPIPPWIALWTDPATAEAVRATIVWSVEMLAVAMPWITPLLDWVGPLLWVIWFLGVVVLVVLAGLGLLLIGRISKRSRISSASY
ncbi:MAG: hypothetical protein EAZ11_14240 [Curvibacter sp.]|nr:MAG: hypothetical protein EAZ11_14240 [Curvibacter sp.]